MDPLDDNRYRDIDQSIQTRIEMILSAYTHLLGQYGIAFNTPSVGLAIDPKEFRAYLPPSRLGQDIPLKIQYGRHEPCRLVETLEQSIHPLEIETLQTVVFHIGMPHNLTVRLPPPDTHVPTMVHSSLLCHH